MEKLCQKFVLDTSSRPLIKFCKKYQTTDPSKKLLYRYDCTKHVQAPDVSWNKPFNTMMTELCDSWLSNEVKNKQPPGI